jgi:hypothetical protein
VFAAANGAAQPEVRRQMTRVTDFPLLVFALSFSVLAACTWLGARLARVRTEGADTRDDLKLVLTAALTLLGLIIGFSFSMAIERYDQRKGYEEAEANAIGTEYLRAGLLPAESVARTRALLKSYLDERLEFYGARSVSHLTAINEKTARLQQQLWSEVQSAAAAQPTPVLAHVVVGMNDVLNSQGYTQAAFRNRIPGAAWVLLLLIAVLCNVLFGYVAPGLRPRRLLLLLPLVLSIAFTLIADIESPRGGLIHVAPENLESLATSFS